MKILTLIKLTVDVSQLKYEKDGSPLVEIAPNKMGDSDKCAVEEAIRLKERYGASVTVLTVGATRDHERIIRDAYAMGVDEGYIVEVEEYQKLQATTIGDIVKAFVEKTGPYDLILLGAGSLDTHSYTLGSIISSKIGIPIISSVDSLSYNGSIVKAESVMEDGVYVFQAPPPLVITLTTEANEPRIPTLKTILKSKKMEVKKLRLEELGVKPRYVTIEDVRKYFVERKKIIIDAGEDLEKAVETIYSILKMEGLVK
ncbi:MAG: hypothetical protein QXL40_04700 [Nitrososphaerota archaeon]